MPVLHKNNINFIIATKTENMSKEIQKMTVITSGVFTEKPYTASDGKPHTVLGTIIKVDNKFKLLILYDEDRHDKFKVPYIFIILSLF